MSIGFTGQYTDAESGLLYMVGRYYDPSTQQFLSRDPLEATTGQPYTYAWGNPTNYIDPTGSIGSPTSMLFQAGGKDKYPPGPVVGGGVAGAGGRGAPSGAGVATAQAVEAGMHQLRAAIASGRIRPINYKYRGQVFRFAKGSKLARKYPHGVRFTEDGFPDFSPYARATVRISMKGKRGGYADVRAANKAAGSRVTENFGVETWHHVEDRVTMQLVPYDLHFAVKHTGGEKIIDLLGELP